MTLTKRFFFLLIIQLALFSIWLVLDDELILGLWSSLLIIIILSFFFAVTSLQRITFSRTSKIKRHQVGGVFEERFEIKNDSAIRKFWIEITDLSKLGKDINSRIIINLKPKQFRITTSSILLLERGIYSLGPTILKSGDPLGLFQSVRNFPPKKTIIVYPHIIELRNFAAQSHSVEGGEHFQTQTAQTTPQASGIREYLPGDPLNRVHWPYTMKHRKIMVKEFDEETQSDAWILIDVQKNKHIRMKDIVYSQNNRFSSIRKKGKHFELPCDSLEYAISIAATLVNDLINRNIAVGLTSVGKDFVNILPDKGSRQLNKILEKLAIIDDDGDLSFDLIFEKQKSNFNKGSIVIMITPTNLSEIEPSIHISKLKRIKLVPIRINVESFRNEKREIIQKIPKFWQTEYIEINYADNFGEKIVESRII